MRAGRWLTQPRQREQANVAIRFEDTARRMHYKFKFKVSITID
jgi:hypothetical protein